MKVLRLFASAASVALVLSVSLVASPVQASSQAPSGHIAVANAAPTCTSGSAVSGRIRFRYQGLYETDITMQYTGCIDYARNLTWGTSLNWSAVPSKGYDPTPRAATEFWGNAWTSYGLAFPRINIYKSNGKWWVGCRDGSGGLPLITCGTY